MKKHLIALVLLALGASGAVAQTAWNNVAEYTTYTDATNPVQPGGNNMLQGAEFTQWIADNNWAELPGGPYATYDGNQFTTGKVTYKVPAGRGEAQWTAQMRLTTKYAVVQGNNYNLSFHVKSTAANKFTVKVEDPNTGGAASIYDSYVTLPANQEVLFVLHNYTANTNLDIASVVFDAGGAQAGSTIEIYDLVLQGELAGPSGGPMELTGAPEGYELVWSDEFDSNTLTTKWNPMDWAAGNVNNELQTYKPGSQAITAANGATMHTAEINNGILTINCFKGQDGKVYSARMDSHDATGKHDGYAAWRYGYMEARIKLPKGTGTWPAFWMMPEGVNWSDEGWPTCGEIDIMEEVGADPNMIVCSLHADGHVHSNNTQVSASKYTEGAEGGWVTYAMLWDKDNISMYANGQRILSYNNDHNGIRNWPYDRPFYIILNLAWGGDWGGYKGVDESALPAKMEVDYVRVYQLPATASLAADGSGTAYIHGPYNGVGSDAFVPSSTFNNWADNYFAIAGDNKVYTKEFTIGKNLHATRGQFKFYATAEADDSKAFTPDGATYRATLEPNAFIEMDKNGLITMKPGLHNNDVLTVTLDCSKGADKAEIRVDWKEGEVEQKDYYIIGAANSICPAYIGTDNDGWDWNTYYITLDQDRYTHSHTFAVGTEIDPEWVNFKFMPQNSWNGGQFSTNTEFGNYTIHYEGDMFMLGNGKNGADNGNIVLAPGKSLKGIREFTAILDLTDGEENAVFRAVFDGEYEVSGLSDITVDTDDADALWYDLSGRVIDRPTRAGFYLHGTRKVIIK